MNSNENEEMVDPFIPPRYDEEEVSPGRRKLYYVEPVLFTLLIPTSMFEFMITNTIEFQYCKSVLHVYNEEACLNRTAPYFDEMEKFSTQFSMARSCIELIFPGICSFFLGPWSDTYGRKPIMLSGSIGLFISYACWTWGISSNLLHPNYFLLFSLPVAFSGGPVLMIIACFCYLCDTTTLETRGTRIGLLTALLYAGSLIGTNVAPYLMMIDFALPFAVCAGLTYLSIMYIHFLLGESVSATGFQRETVGKNPFQIKQLKDLYETVYQKQTKETFTTIMFIILLVSIGLIQGFGESKVFYLFLQKILGWNLEDYTPLNSISIITTAVLSYGGTWFFCKYLRLSDMLVLAIVCFFRLLSAVTLMFAYKIWHVYLAKILNGLNGVYGAVIRLFLSRIIAPEDLGKVFSFIGSLESLTPLIGSLTYGGLFSATVETVPRAFFFLSGFLCAVINVILAIIVHITLRHPARKLIVPQTSSINA